MPLIKTVDLCQRFGEREVLKKVNLRLEKGEAFALIGPAGAGKTTLLRLIDLLDFPASGQIYFDGTDVTQSEKTRLELRRRLAFVLQKPVVFTASVYDNIAYSLRWRNLEKNSLRQKVSQILEMVDLTPLKNRNARHLSGGEAQRVAIARALVSEPEVLLLDEPLANLDPVSTSKIEELINRIRHQHQTTLIIATHDMSQGQRLANRVGVLFNGEIIQSGDWRQIFNFPQNREIAEFVGIENMLPGVVVASDNRVVTIAIGDRVIEAVSDYPVAQEIYACIRAEDITLALTKLSTSARNSFLGEIRRVVSLGPVSRIEIDCSFILVALVTKRSVEELNLEPGKKVFATFKATQVHVIKREGD